MQPSLLIVDDQELIIRIIQAAVKPLSAKTIIARSGEEALTLLRGNPLPDVIVLDYSMPGKNGLETLSDIRQIHGGKDIPVIMLTARDQTSIRKSLDDLGISRFLTKPFSPALLCRQIEELL